MRIQSFIVVVAGCLAVLSNASAAHAAAKPCDLLSSQDASALLGTPVKPLMQMDQYCGYQSISQKENTNVGLSLSSAAGATAATLNALVAKGDTTETIAGLGDSNLLITKGRDMYTFAVIYHGQLVSISMAKRPSPALKAALIAEMRGILGKI